MKNAFVILLILIIVALGIHLYNQSQVVRNQDRRIHELIAKLQMLPRAPTLEEQAKCAAQAREAFAFQGYKAGEMAGFESHYNLKFNKCFVEIYSTDTRSARPEILHSKFVADAFEGKTYGSYILETHRGKKYWEVPPLECKVTLPSGQEKICSSDQEFDELVKQYME